MDVSLSELREMVMDREAWRAAIHGVAKSRTLSDWVTELKWTEWLMPEKGMAIHSSILAWRIPWTGKPGGLQSTGLQRVGHHWVTNPVLSYTSNATKRIYVVEISLSNQNVFPSWQRLTKLCSFPIIPSAYYVPRYFRPCSFSPEHKYMCRNFSLSDFCI